MSELIQKHDNRATIRWKLLTGVSALALAASVSSGGMARAEDASQPQIWIELGGQLSQLEDGQETFSPSFPNSPPRPSMFSPSQPFERPPLYGIDEFSNISFQPENSDWVFSAGIRYGRSASRRNVHQQTYPKSFVTRFSIGTRPYTYSVRPSASNFSDTAAKTNQAHLILDFQAGKDVGLGLFGSGSSTLSVGVRIAQFTSKSDIALKSHPDWHRLYKYASYPSLGIHAKFPYASPYHSNSASLRATRKFRGVGPSLSWNASVPFAGNSQDASLTFDWGLNAALLFGRQSAKTHHQTTGRYHLSGLPPPSHRPITYQNPATPDHARSRIVMAPNAGGFAAISFKYNDAKLSFGYKADFFFNAMDGGIDTRKEENRSFFGPYASISVGLGD